MDRHPAEAVWSQSPLEASVGVDRFRWQAPALQEPERPEVPRLLAGAAEVDLTPPPGMPKAGHSRNAHDGDGFRTRLKARVVHLRSGRSSVALVAVDLLAGSALLQRALAERLAGTDLGLEGIFLAATHTHAGPGQYSGSRFYNTWASNRPGFDPGYAGFLLEQLTEAVGTAVGSRVPARAAIGSTEVWGLTRNRALSAHVRNADVDDPRTGAHRRYAAVDPRLHLLRVDDEDGPLAAFSWFSVHGTGISHHDRAYNADLWSYLNGELASRVEARTGRRPVSAAVVAAHGDVTPAVRPGMLVYPEAERVGRGIGAAAAELHERLAAGLRPDLPIAVALSETDLSLDPEIDGVRLPPPRLGWPKAAGAAENATAVLPSVPPFRPGRAPRPRGPHGAKRVIGTERGHGLLAGRTEDFPAILPVHLLRLGTTAVLGLPFEVSTIAGRRIAAEARGADPELTDALVSSLVDDHCDYLTTGEEYAVQCYEGASTLFGPEQLRFVAGLVRRLVRQRDTPPPKRPSRVFDFAVRRYLAVPRGADVAAAVFGPAGFVEATAEEDAHWRTEWSDRPPGDLAWHRPLLRVETRREQGAPWQPLVQHGAPVDDQGWRIGIRYLGRTGGRDRYEGRWFRPPLGRPGSYRFVLVENGGRPETAGPAFD